MNPLPAKADKSQPLAERKALYAPWNPADMTARRQDQRLIDPGAKNPFRKLTPESWVSNFRGSVHLAGRFFVGWRQASGSVARGKDMRRPDDRHMDDIADTQLGQPIAMQHE